MPKLPHTALIATLGAMSTALAYQYSEIQSLKGQPRQSQAISEHKVVALVDQRLEVLERRRAKDGFEKKVFEFELAQQSTPDHRLIYGNPEARITLQEFGDIECPFCRKMHDDLKQVVDNAENTINWEFKHFPLESHNPAAALQAKVIECVKDSYGNKVAWAALDRFIFETAGNGKGVGDLTNFVRGMGLSGVAIDLCMASDAHENRIESDYREGQALGITGTPALRIIDTQTGDAYLIKGYKTAEQIAQAVQHILRG